jgi:hypothetical protein
MKPISIAMSTRAESRSTAWASQMKSVIVVPARTALRKALTRLRSAKVSAKAPAASSVSGGTRPARVSIAATIKRPTRFASIVVPHSRRTSETPERRMTHDRSRFAR